MASVTCPVAGFESVKLTLPDEWLVKHNEAFWSGVRQAGDDVSMNTALLFGSVAVCEKIEGLPEGSPLEWPLPVFHWIVNTVYYDNLQKALNPPKNS